MLESFSRIGMQIIRKTLLKNFQEPPFSVRLTGATGPGAFLINGIYDPSIRYHNGMPIYEKRTGHELLMTAGKWR